MFGNHHYGIRQNDESRADNKVRVVMSDKVRIYRPAKNAMQSGRANSKRWIVESEPASRKKIDTLMGWTGSDDTRTQVKLRFDTREDAVAYAERNGLEYRVEEPKERIIKPKNYAENFSPNRLS